MNLKELRKSLGLTQMEVSNLVDIPIRTYQNYENDAHKKNTIKYKYIINMLSKKSLLDEMHGILDLDEIILRVNDILVNYEVEYCYLFGSYAKNQAKESSDINLMVKTDVKGIKFFGMVESLRSALNKRVDVITLASLNQNIELLNEILKDGIKIYG